MQRSATVDPRMVPALLASGLFPHTCAIQSRTDVQTPTGSPRPSWSTRAGLGAVPCRRSALNLAAGGREVRTVAIAAVEENDYVLALAGYFPQITAKDSALFDDGTRYDINNVNHDSASVMTSLLVRTVQPIADPGV
jgi:TPP-dependent trihydroxycyclohexane-1,2-dione (THcHDO) dehydratase